MEELEERQYVHNYTCTCTHAHVHVTYSMYMYILYVGQTALGVVIVSCVHDHLVHMLCYDYTVLWDSTLCLSVGMYMYSVYH